MENERPIEKLLRRCAKRRGEETGAPLELHPANRQVLQGEVARQYPAKSAATGGRPGALGWKNLWPRLVWALPVLMVLTLGVWTLVQQQKPQPGAAELAKADSQPPAPSRENPATRSEAAEAALPVHRAAATPTLAEPPLKLEQDNLMVERSRPLTTVAPTRGAGPPPPAFQTAPLADRSIGSEPPTPVAAPSRSLGVARSDPAPENYARSTAPQAMPPPPASSPTAPAPTRTTPAVDRYGISASAPATLSQRFVQTPVEPAARSLAGSAPVRPQVLASFRVEQDGSQLRVVDSDGSTYIGSIELPPIDRSAATAQTRKEAAEPATQGQFAVTQADDEAKRGLPLNQAFNFRVTGTNRTLQQPVVFAGNILMPTNVISIQQASPAAGVAGGQSTQMQQLLPMPANSTISGRLQLGKNPETQINAVPALP
ncbi:MAG: hypothetical protein IH623_06840 [Verrucomicrobia bacterium]|nr:hypothetical protein [Verrucomicrobiota bacterium]